MIILAIPFLQVRELGGRRADWSGKSSSTRRTRSWSPTPSKSSAAACRLISTPRHFPAPRWSSRSTRPPPAARREAPAEFGRRVVFVSSNDSAASAHGSRAVHRSRLRADRTRTIDEGGVLIQPAMPWSCAISTAAVELEKSTSRPRRLGGNLTPVRGRRPRPLVITFSVRHLVVGRTGAVRRLLRSDHGAQERNSSIMATIAVGSVNPVTRTATSTYGPPTSSTPQVPHLCSCRQASTLRADAGCWTLFHPARNHQTHTIRVLLSRREPRNRPRSSGRVRRRDRPEAQRFGVLTDTPVLSGGGPMVGEHRRRHRVRRGDQGTLRADGRRGCERVTAVTSGTRPHHDTFEFLRRLGRPQQPQTNTLAVCSPKTFGCTGPTQQ